MLGSINWQEFAGFVTVIGFFCGFFWRFQKHISKKFDQIDDRFEQINKRFSSMEKTHYEYHLETLYEFTEIKERLSFLEAANIYTMPLEPAKPNARSNAAREMWKRRKQKTVEHKPK